MSQINELRNRADTYLATARKILSKAESEGRRELSPAEKLDWDGLLRKSEDLKRMIRSHDGVRDAMIDLDRPAAFGAWGLTFARAR